MIQQLLVMARIPCSHILKVPMEKKMLVLKCTRAIYAHTFFSISSHFHFFCNKRKKKCVKSDGESEKEKMLSFLRVSCIVLGILSVATRNIVLLFGVFTKKATC